MGADLQLKSTMVTPTRSNSRPPVVLVSPPPRPHQSNTNTNTNSCNPPPPPPSFSPYSAAVQDPSASSSIILAYEHYLRLPALSTLWTTKTFPEWKNESIVKPSLQALEITFRLISIALSDPRPYSNHRQWTLRLESLSSRQIQIIALLLSNHHDNSGLPIATPSSHTGVIPRDKSSQEVWHLNLVNNNNTTTTTTTTTTTSTTLVSHTSEASLLPRLAAWDKSEDVASKILLQIESQMYTCPFTLGLGEPNLAGKQNNLEYDLIVRPSELHSLKKSPLLDHDQQQLKNNQENQILFTIHQIIESWLYTAQQLLKRIGERIDGQQFEEAASDCWVLEKIWMLLSDIEDLHLLMDPDDFLRLTTQLAIRSCPTPPGSSSSSSSSSSNAAASAICFRSRALLSVTKSSKDLKQRVPQIVGVEADPNGGPRVQEAAMKLLHSRTRGEADNSGRIHLLQAFQAVEGAVKRFFFAYRQLVTAVMGSLEATGNRGLGFAVETSSDSLCQMFMDPPYFPSLDAAKTFLGELWQCEAKFSTSTSNINHNY